MGIWIFEQISSIEIFQKLIFDYLMNVYLSTLNYTHIHWLMLVLRQIILHKEDDFEENTTLNLYISTYDIPFSRCLSSNLQWHCISLWWSETSPFSLLFESDCSLFTATRTKFYKYLHTQDSVQHWTKLRNISGNVNARK